MSIIVTHILCSDDFFYVCLQASLHFFQICIFNLANLERTCIMLLECILHIKYSVFTSAVAGRNEHKTLEVNSKIICMCCIRCYLRYISPSLRYAKHLRITDKNSANAVHCWSKKASNKEQNMLWQQNYFSYLHQVVQITEMAILRFIRHIFKRSLLCM